MKLPSQPLPNIVLQDQSYRVIIAFLATLLTFLCWLNTGTLSPYALFNPQPIIDHCGYLLNTDDPHFKACFFLLEGRDRTFWDQSVVLRRILYPIFAYPFMQLLPYLVAGFIVNIVLLISSFVVFTNFIVKRAGYTSALIAAVLLTSYPGISYWVGLPYSYASIVPISLFSFLLIHTLAEDRSIRWLILSCLGVGILSISYDILPFFGLASLIILCAQKRWWHLPFATILLAAPQTFSNWILWKIYDLPVLNSNSQSITTILASFLSSPGLAPWWKLILESPFILLHNFLFSNFLILPILFAIIVVISLFEKKSMHYWGLPETSLLLSILAVFLLNNLAPPYQGWQLRGYWIARLYQPAFVGLIIIISRIVPLLSGIRRAIGICVLIPSVVLNIAVIAGPWWNPTLTGWIYHHFYQQSAANIYVSNLEKYGARPLGFCSKYQQDSTSSPSPSH